MKAEPIVVQYNYASYKMPLFDNYAPRMLSRAYGHKKRRKAIANHVAHFCPPFFLGNIIAKPSPLPNIPKIGVVWREVESGKRSSISGDNYMKSRLISVLNHHH